MSCMPVWYTAIFTIVFTLAALAVCGYGIIDCYRGENQG
jgi:hypothetical protein